MKKINAIITSAVIAMPFFASAQGTLNTTFFEDAIIKFRRLLNLITPVIITLAIIFFLWSLLKFIRSKADGKAEDVKQARMGIIWSIVAIFIMLSFLGIVRILQGITGTQNAGNITNQDLPVVTF